MHTCCLESCFLLFKLLEGLFFSLLTVYVSFFLIRQEFILTSCASGVQSTMSNCGKCKSKKNDGLVGCEGPCQRWYHYSCIQMSESEFKFVQKCSNILYLCDQCKPKCEVSEKPDASRITTTLNQISDNINLINGSIEKTIQSKLMEFTASLGNSFDNKLSELNGQIQSLKSDMQSILSQEHSMPNSSKSIRSYSDVVENKASVIVKPKIKQNSNETKCDVMKSINPVSSNINLASVKTVRDGGIFVSCSNSSECTKFKELAGSTLSDKYEVKEIVSLNPRIKIVGLSEKFDPDLLTNYIKNQNKQLISSSSELKYLNLTPLRKNQNMYQASYQVDRTTYGRIMAEGKLFVGYDYCTVFNAIELRRCFKCSGFHHFANKCTSNEFICPRCAQNHPVKECKSEVLCCINCYNLKKKKDSKHADIDFSHAVWDSKCYAYRQNLDSFISNILETQ